MAANYITFGSLKVLPKLNSTFGAESSGIDWTKPVTKDVIQELISIQNKYGVIIFRDTGLDSAGHVRFAAQLGDLEKNPSWGGSERVGMPYLFDVSNVEADGSLVKKGTRRWAHALGNSLWHTDSSFNQHRCKYSLLLSHAIPKAGHGNTWFADTGKAFNDLPADEKRELRTLTAEHSLWHSRKSASPEHYTVITEEERRAKPPAYHKLVQTAPNGEETLFIATHVSRLFNKQGREVPNSPKLIAQLIDHYTQPQYIFSAQWETAGDMMWWDNRQSMHRASPYDEQMGIRDVRRATVYDDGKDGFGISETDIAAILAS